MNQILFTGFPGFLGSELVPRILEKGTDSTAICVVQSKYGALAESRAEQITAARPALRGRIRIARGDVTAPNLGLPNARDLFTAITQIYHLAAIYDLSVDRATAHRVNVEGTRNVIAFAENCPSLRRLAYMSTCYVSGRFHGIFTEEDLERGQDFNNYYEETKYLAEVEIQRNLRNGLPATIFRPSIVVGDSITGETQKYDGPYYAIRWLLRQRRVAWMPVVGNSRRTELNVVPRDFIVEAIGRLTSVDDSIGKVYHLCDPEPLNIHQLLAEVGRATGRSVVKVRLPRRFAKFALNHLPGVQRLLRMPSALIDYMVHPTLYRAPATSAALSKLGLTAPRFPQYVDNLVDFVRAHPEISSNPMA